MSVAVLLDKFVTATAEMEMEEQQIQAEEIKKKHQVPDLSSVGAVIERE